MKKIGFLLAVVVLLGSSGIAQGGEPDKGPGLDIGDPTLEMGVFTEEEFKREFHTTLDFTYTSRHIWRGFDFFPSNTGAFSTSADVDFWGTGFGANILWTRPIKSGYEFWEWLVFEPYYEEDECWDDYWYEMDYRFGWRYYYFPDGPLNHSCHHRDLDFQEFYGRFAWPSVFPYRVVPYYEAARIWPSKGGRHSNSSSPRSYWRQYGGWFHTFGLYKDWELNGFLPKYPGQVIRTGFGIVFNDGAGPTVDSSKNNADHDWSHCFFNLSTDFKLADNISLTTGLNYQASMDQSVNNDDECWISVGTRISF